MNRAAMRQTFTRFDIGVTRWAARNSQWLLRCAMGSVFLWFGALKLVPGMSPAHDLAARTILQLSFGMIQPELSLPLLALWEVAIGLGLISGRFMRATILLLMLQMLGTITPVFLFPAEIFTRVPIAPTLEGQYIIKNVIIVAAAMTLGAMVRGGRVTSEPE